MAIESNLTELTAFIVGCFVSNNAISAVEVMALIASTHTALRGLDSVRFDPENGPTPAAPIQDSITQDYLICLNDGRKLRMLKRYIQRKYSLSPEQYRAKWGLPSDYPMVAPAYSELRSKIAKDGARRSSNRSRAKERERL